MSLRLRSSWVFRFIRTLKYALIHIFIIAILYCNVAEILITTRIRFPKAKLYGDVPSSIIYRQCPLPNHWTTSRLFLLFGLFSHWNWTNTDYAAYGVKKRLYHLPAKPINTIMMDLDIYQHFPPIKGKANKEIFLSPYRKDPRRLKKAYARMADDIQRLHNKDHPHEPVEQVFLYGFTWKKSVSGYFHNYADKKTFLLGHN